MDLPFLSVARIGVGFVRGIVFGEWDEKYAEVSLHLVGVTPFTTHRLALAGLVTFADDTVLFDSGQIEGWFPATLTFPPESGIGASCFEIKTSVVPKKYWHNPSRDLFEMVVVTRDVPERKVEHA